MNLRLPLSVDDVNFVAAGVPSTATILGFTIADFSIPRSEPHDSDDEDYKRAKAADLVINDVAELAQP